MSVRGDPAASNRRRVLAPEGGRALANRPGRLTRPRRAACIGVMRIIGGQFKRRILSSPRDASTTRPIPDRVKEAAFNILRGHVEGQVVIDAFAGTGSIGLEALSRGASRAAFIEKDRAIQKLLRSNIEKLGVAEQSLLIHADALAPAAIASCPRPVHLIFFDPPYRLVESPATRRRVLDALGRFITLLDDDGFAILRTPWPLRDKPEKVESEAAKKGPALAPEQLRIAGAEGPETHDYNNMALHLYMRTPPDERTG